MEGTKIYNRFDSHLPQALHTLCCGLGASVQIVADFMQVVHTVELQGLSPRRRAVACMFRRCSQIGQNKAYSYDCYGPFHLMIERQVSADAGSLRSVEDQHCLLIRFERYAFQATGFTDGL